MNSKMVSGGVQDSYLGIKYQLDIILLCAHRSVGESNIKYFQLNTEQDKVGCFDDIVLKIIENKKQRYVFGQAKYKVSPFIFDFKKIMMNGKFKLSKYFDSWREILKQKQYKKTEITILIITNNQLDTAQILQNGLVKIDSDDLLSSLYFVEDNSDDMIFKDVGKRYKFPDIAAFPAERQAVFQVLKNDFLNNNSGKKLSDFDLKLNSFMDRFVFVTSLEIKDIQELIQKDLQVKFKMKNVSAQYLKLEECIRNFVTSRNNQIQKITKGVYEKVFKEYELFEDKMVVIRSTRTIFDDDLRLEFQITNKTIEDFLDPQISQTNNILHVKTQTSETGFVCMWIHSMLSTTADKDTYIMMKTSKNGENYDRGVKVFEAEESFKFIIIEVDSEESLFGKFSDRLTNSLQNSSKQLIVVSDVKSGVKLQNCSYSEEEVPHIYPKELSQDSLTKVLSRPVYFQNNQTTWEKLTNENYLKNKVLLKDLLKASTIAKNVRISKEFDEGLYVSRTFIYKNVLKSKVLIECKDDEFVDNEADFQAKIQSNPGKNIHLLEREGDTLQWMKTSGDISNILKFIDEKNTKRPRENLLIDLSSSTRVSIITDVAGMGKSTLLNYLARKLKKSHPNLLVMKVDLNDFTGELSEAVVEDLKTPQKAIEFLTVKIMKLESQFDKELFRESCESVGNVILLFDGFDEIANYYKDQVTQLIESLLKTKIEKFFIASRPEWSDYLVKTFSQIKHALQPFGKEVQEHYLFNFIKERIERADEVKLKRIIQTVLKLMSTSISDNNYKFTGVPLITKLVGEFFESKISEYFQASTEDFEVFIQRLEKETFDLIKLYDHFVEKKLQVFYEEKCKMILSNPQASRMIKQMKQKILENYETHAVKQILKSDVKKYFPSIAAKKLDEEEQEDLVKVGLVAHQTYVEYGFNKFLDKNFDDENCAKFIVKAVLGYTDRQVIRSFMNFWILKKVNQKTCAVYQKILLLDSSIVLTPFHVAGREGNENIFCLLYSALATRTEDFKKEKTKIQDYLLKFEGDNYDVKFYPYTAFVEYFWFCEDHFNILSKVQSDFGVEFLINVLTIKMHNKERFLHAICQRDSENIFKILNFVRETFISDLKFLKKVFLSADKDGASFLHFAFKNLEIETLFCLFEELNLLKELLGQDFFNELILMRSHYYGGGVFLSHYAWSKYFSNDHFISFLIQVKFLCDQETFKELFFVASKGSQTLLHHCCYHAKNFDLLQVLEWVAQELGKKALAELILVGNKKNERIFHRFTSSPHQSNSGPKLLSILSFLKNDLKFENDFLVDQILFYNSEDSESVVSNMFLQNQEISFSQNVLDFLANELNLKNDSFKKYLIQNKSLLFQIAQIKENQFRVQLLNFFIAKFGKTFFNCFDSIETFYRICEKYSENDTEKILNYLNWIAENDFELLKKYVSGKNSKKQTILFYFHHRLSKLILMLEWFKTTFKNDQNFLEKILLEVDENLDSFLYFVLKKCKDDWQIYDSFIETYKFLMKNFDKVFVKEFLLLQNKKGKIFLNIICENSYNLDMIFILDTLFKDFQNDQDFFANLINEKSKKNRKVKDFMKNKFNIDFAEEETGRTNYCEIS